jgi:aspartyl-tRNA(Asn)/glutamyl-tRNA(Gln) amidotransferase subunit B
VLSAVSAGADAKKALDRAANEVAARMDGARRLDPDAFARLVLMEGRGELTATQAKQVLAELLENGGDPAAIAAERGFEALAGDAVAAAVDEAIAANPDQWAKYLDGNDKVASFFVGAVMKATGGKAAGAEVTKLLQQRRA